MSKRFLSVISILLIIFTLFSTVSCASNKAGNDDANIDDEHAYLIYDSSLEDGESGEGEALENGDNGAADGDVSIKDALLSSTEQASIKLRFGSYNIQHGAANKSLDKIAKNITDQNLDIVAIQEADKGTKRSGRADQMKRLSELTGYKHYFFVKAIDHDGGEYGIGVLSKYAFVNKKAWGLPSGSYERRVIARVQIRVQGVLMNFYATHLSYDGESAAMRKKQFAEIANLVKNDSNFVIAGDFNTGKFAEFEVLDNHATNKTMTLNRTNHMKYTEPSSKLAIDNIVFRNWTFGKPQVVNKSYSDHYMLWGEGVFSGGNTTVSNITVGESTSVNTVKTPPQRNGNKVIFGTYPKSKITDSTWIATLNGKAGTPVTNGKSWGSYGYSDNKNMYYIDVEEGAERYRGVYFTAYRPTEIAKGSSVGNSLQDDNGYSLNTVYWFKHEPVSWTVIDTDGNKALLFCDMIVDAQPYGADSKNNYANSTVRAWLNGAFLNTAFSEVQKQYIQITTVDNGRGAADYRTENPYLGENTNDKIFLISKAEVKKAAYGFTSDSVRVKKVTDYAKSQGAFANGNNEDWWWLRTPSYSPSISTKNDLAHNIKVAGSIWSTNVAATSGGIVPMMWIDFSVQPEDIPSNGNTGDNIQNEDNSQNGDNGNVESGAADYAPIRNGNKVTFGSYPQSKVENSALIATLNGKVSTPAANASAWTSYGYYGNGEMYFTDVEEGGERYRGVYFSKYRPTNVTSAASASNSLQDDNGYALNKAHWFKYDPISWTVLEEKNGAALVFCDMIVDAQTYDDTVDNNYADSTIRAWLNKTFVDTAFTALQKELILTTEVNNGLSASDYRTVNPFLCANTSDKVFLLSKAEVKNSAYGFTSDSVRVKKATEYAKSQGAFANAENVDWWWLRTPSYTAATPQKNDLVHNVKVAGSLWSTNVAVTSGGVVPAMWIKI